MAQADRRGRGRALDSTVREKSEYGDREETLVQEFKTKINIKFEEVWDRTKD
jgi:hypothetical protein